MYADTLPPQMDEARKKLGDLAESEEDVLSYLAFPEIAEKFLRQRKEKQERTVRYTIERVEAK